MEKGFFHQSRGYWQATGDVPAHILETYPEGTVEVPLKPGADYEWQGEWVAVAIDHAAVLAAWRGTASLSFPQFVIASEENGWITTAEAEAWLAGSALPNIAEQALTMLPEKSGSESPRLRGRAKAMRPSRIERMHPLLLAVASAKGVTEKEIDAVFRDYQDV